MGQLKDLQRRIELIEHKAIVLRQPNNMRILGVLDNFAQNPFNDGSLAMSLATLSNATGLSESDVALALADLTRATFVETDATKPPAFASSGTSTKITDEGRWAMQTAIAISKALLA